MDRENAGRRNAPGENALADLLRLPAARNFPPLLGAKRERHERRGEAPGPRAAAAAAAAHPLLASATQLRGKGAGLLQHDPTGLLLMEAASQLNELVHAQLQRRTLKASLRSGAAGAAAALSDSDSEAEGGDGGDCAAELSTPSMQRPAESGSVSASAGGSLGSSLPDSGPVSLSRHKRIRLERQYAIDLGGLCVMGAQRQRLPLPDELASLVR